MENENLTNLSEDFMKKEYLKRAMVSKIGTDIAIECMYSQVFSLVGASSLVLGPDFLKAYKNNLDKAINDEELEKQLKNQYREAANGINIKELITKYKNLAMIPVITIEKVFKELEKESEAKDNG